MPSPALSLCQRTQILFARAKQGCQLTSCAYKQKTKTRKQAHLRARALENSGGDGGRRCLRDDNLGLNGAAAAPALFNPPLPLAPGGLGPPRRSPRGALGLRLGARRQRAGEARRALGAGAVAPGLVCRRGMKSFFSPFVSSSLSTSSFLPFFFFASREGKKRSGIQQGRNLSSLSG